MNNNKKKSLEDISIENEWLRQCLEKKEKEYIAMLEKNVKLSDALFKIQNILIRVEL